MSEEDNQRWLVIDGRGEREYQGGGEYGDTPNFFGQQEFSSYDEMICCIKKHIDDELRFCKHAEMRLKSAIPHLIFYKIQDVNYQLPKELKEYFSDAKEMALVKEALRKSAEDERILQAELKKFAELKAKYPNLI